MQGYTTIALLFAVVLGAAVSATGNVAEHGPSHKPTISDHRAVQPSSVALTREQALTIARQAIREALKVKGAVFPVPWLDDDRVWIVETDPEAPGKWLVGWGGNPTGGGYHGGVVIDQVSGQVESVHIGRHLR
jgi:hypothetical protein